jgi:hypothetical protein
MRVPRRQFVDAIDFMFGDTAKDIRQPSLIMGASLEHQ